MVLVCGQVFFTPGIFFLEVGWEALVFGHFSPSPVYRLLTFPFILTCVCCPSSTCRFKLSKTDTCPISPYPKSLGVVVKAKEFGSVRCRILNGSKDSFPQIFQMLFQAQSYTLSAPLFGGTLGPAEDRTVLGCIPRICRALSYQAWAIALLGSDLRIPHG